MARENVFGFKLSDVELRQKLAPRFAPYWQVTQYGRALGYQRYPSGQSYWVARMRLKDASYVIGRLGVTEDNEDMTNGLSFSEALIAAELWFARSPHLPEASDARPIGSVDYLLACPIGDIFTVGHALTDYVEWKRLVAAPSHFLTVVTLINYHLLTRLFDLPARDMNPARLRVLVQDMLETPPKPGNHRALPRRPITEMSPDQLRKRKKTVNTVIGILRLALIMAWESSHIESDRPWRCLRRLNNVDRPRILHLSRPECHRLLEACRSDLRQLVLAALYTGCRVTELLSMRAMDVGRDGQGVYVRPLKSHQDRVVLLPDEGLRFFEKAASGKTHDELLFVRQDGKRWDTSYRWLFKRAVKQAALPLEFCFHGLRHTYASQLIQDATPLIVVAEQLGHRNIETVSRTYGHLSPDARLAEVRKRFASLT